MKRKFLSRLLSTALVAGMILTSVPVEAIAAQDAVIIEEAAAEDFSEVVLDDAAVIDDITVETAAETVIEDAVIEEKAAEEITEETVVEESLDTVDQTITGEGLTKTVQSGWGYETVITGSDADFPAGASIEAEILEAEKTNELADIVKAAYTEGKQVTDFIGLSVKVVASTEIDAEKTVKITSDRSEYPEMYVNAETLVFAVDADNNVRQLTKDANEAKISEVSYVVLATAYVLDERFYDDKDLDIPLEVDITDSAYAMEKASIPPYYRNTNVPALRNQNPFGSCFAHSSTAIGEINRMKKGAPEQDYSERHLAYFTYNFDGSTMDPLGNMAGDKNSRCDGDPFYEGGNISYTSPTLANWVGHAAESVAPYERKGSGDNMYLDPVDKSLAMSATSHLQGYYIASKSKEPNKVKQLIMDYGAVGVSYYHDNSYYNETNNAYYKSTTSGTNHAVTCVGWDDNFPKENFSIKPEGNGAWLIRNSWWNPVYATPAYGSISEDSKYGYFWLSYYDKSLRDDVFAFDEEPADNYDFNYQYDGGYGTGTWGGSGTMTAANVFTANGSAAGEIIEAASFYTGTASVPYVVTVYTGLKSATDPTSGTKKTSKSGTTDCMGYYTVKFDEGVEVDKGEKFSIVVELKKSGAKIGAENSITTSTWLKSTTKALAGQSFYKNGSSWADYGKSKNANFRIKAFTTADDPANAFYNIVFDGNGGSGSIASIKQNCGTAPALPANAFEREGWIFAGWSKDRDGKEKIYKPGEIIEEMKSVKKRDTYTVYAVWQKKILIDAFSVAGTSDGLYPINAEIVLKTLPDGADIYYTIDGTNPTVNKNAADGAIAPTGTTKHYEDVIVLTNDTTSPKTYTIKAIAFMDGCIDADLTNLGDFTVEGLTDADIWGDIDVTNGDRAIWDNDPSKVPTGLWTSLEKFAGTNYTGYQIKFYDTLRVYCGKKRLFEGNDYTVKYANNIKASTATTKASITITGKGNYTGSYVKKFDIYPLSLGTEAGANTAALEGVGAITNSPNVSASTVYFSYNGKVQKGVPTVVYTQPESGIKFTLKKGTDFTLEYPNESPTGAFGAAGNHLIVIRGKGNYSGVATAVESIVADKIQLSKVTVKGVKNVDYKAGHPVTIADMPEFKVTSGNIELKAGTDFDISYVNNDVAGTAKMILTATPSGKCFGVKEVSFKINGTPISKAKVNGFTSLEFNGSARTHASLSLAAPDGKALVKGTDYEVYYQNNYNAGTAYMYLVGLNGYTGTVKKSFKITPTNKFQIASIESPANFYKSGAKVYPVVKGVNGEVLYEGYDYTVSYKNNKAVTSDPRKIPTVTIKGKGNYTGSLSKTFKINKSNIADNMILVQDVPYQDKAGLKTTFTLTDWNGAKLGTGDYNKDGIKYIYRDGTVVTQKVKEGKTTKTVYVSRAAGAEVDTKNDIIPVNTRLIITIPANARGYYTGTVEGSFRVVAASLAKATVKVNKSLTYSENGYVKVPKDAINVVMNRTSLRLQDFEIESYSNNTKKGTASVTIRGVGNYGGYKTVTFKINAKSISSATTAK